MRHLFESGANEMSILSISSTEAQQLWQLLETSSQTESTSANNVQAVSTGTESVDLSEPGKAFNKLKQLAESDPKKFQTVMATVGDEIENAAESSSDEKESSMLKKVAEGFKKAGESGDLSQALPLGPPPAPASESTTGGQINAYSNTQDAGLEGFRAVSHIIHEILDINEILDKNVSS
jgi:hypothetical protein